jgi:hypothetical protein
MSAAARKIMALHPREKPARKHGHPNKKGGRKAAFQE